MSNLEKINIIQWFPEWLGNMVEKIDGVFPFRPVTLCDQSLDLQHYIDGKHNDLFSNDCWNTATQQPTCGLENNTLRFIIWLLVYKQNDLV